MRGTAVPSRATASCVAVLYNKQARDRGPCWVAASHAHQAPSADHGRAQRAEGEAAGSFNWWRLTPQDLAQSSAASLNRSVARCETNCLRSSQRQGARTTVSPESTDERAGR